MGTSGTLVDRRPTAKKVSSYTVRGLAACVRVPSIPDTAAVERLCVVGVERTDLASRFPVDFAF